MHHLKLSGGCDLRTPELSCGSQRWSCHLEGKDAGLIPLRKETFSTLTQGGPRRGRRGEGSPKPQGDLLSKQRNGDFIRSMGLAKSVRDPGPSLSYGPGAGRPYPPLHHQRERKGRGVTSPVSSEQGFLNHITLFQFPILKEKNCERVII